jgi:hypothetical protein
MCGHTVQEGCQHTLLTVHLHSQEQRGPNTVTKRVDGVWTLDRRAHWRTAGDMDDLANASVCHHGSQQKQDQHHELHQSETQDGSNKPCIHTFTFGGTAHEQTPWDWENRFTA